MKKEEINKRINEIVSDVRFVLECALLEDKKDIRINLIDQENINSKKTKGVCKSFNYETNFFDGIKEPISKYL